MRNSNFLLLIIIIPLFFSSCRYLLENTKFKKRQYSYGYKGFAKSIDFSSGDFLLTTIASTSSGVYESTSDKLLKDFLSSELGDRLKTSDQLKDENDKYLIPFDLSFDNFKDDLGSLREVSNCDYVISAKIFYLDDTRHFGVNKFDESRNLSDSRYKSACQVALVVYDLKTEKEIFNLECLGTIWIDREDEGKNNLYKSSKSAGPAVMKKVIKKIK